MWTTFLAVAISAAAAHLLFTQLGGSILNFRGHAISSTVMDPFSATNTDRSCCFGGLNTSNPSGGNDWWLDVKRILNEKKGSDNSNLCSGAAAAHMRQAENASCAIQVCGECKQLISSLHDSTHGRMTICAGIGRDTFTCTLLQEFTLYAQTGLRRKKLSVRCMLWDSVVNIA